MHGAQPQLVVIANHGIAQLLREKLPSNGAVIVFAEQEAAHALALIAEKRPAVVAVERAVALAGPDGELLARVRDVIPPGSEIRILMQEPDGTPSVLRRSLSAAPEAAIIAAARPLDRSWIRRAPRFSVKRGTAALVNGDPSALVNLSVIGAQLVSPSVLRPNQRIRVGLLEDDRELRLTGAIAWSTFEPVAQPRYRAGIEFTDGDTAALEQFCRHYCEKHGR
jgi:hypothetical protein